jgi:integrase/recombinase XerD
LIYYDIVRRYGKEVGITIDAHGVSVHSLRVTAVMNAIADGADITKVQEWPGHVNVSTTHIYDKRGMRAEESPHSKLSSENQLIYNRGIALS